jgi:N-acetylneuraminate synthase
VPLRKGQLSCREILNGAKLTEPVKMQEPLTIEHVDGPYAESDYLRQFILDRGF